MFHPKYHYIVITVSFLVRKYVPSKITVELSIMLHHFKCIIYQSFLFIFPNVKAKFYFFFLNLTATTRKENQASVTNIWGRYLKSFLSIRLCRIYIMNIMMLLMKRYSCSLIVCFNSQIYGTVEGCPLKLLSSLYIV